MHSSVVVGDSSNDLGEQHVVTGLYCGNYGGEGQYRIIQGNSTIVSRVSCGKNADLEITGVITDISGGKLYLTVLKGPKHTQRCGCLQIRDFHSSELLGSIELGKISYPGFHLKLSPDCQDMIIGNVPELVLWNVSDPKSPSKMFERSIDQWDCYCFNCHNEALNCSAIYKTLQVFDRVTGTVIRSFALPIDDISTLYSPVHVMSPELHILPTTLVPHPAAPEIVALHADHDHVRILSIDESSAPQVLLWVRGTRAVSFLHDTLVCIVGKHHARIWDYSTQERIHKFSLTSCSNFMFIPSLNSLFAVCLGDKAGCRTIDTVDLPTFRLTVNLLTIQELSKCSINYIFGTYQQCGVVLL